MRTQYLAPLLLVMAFLLIRANAIYAATNSELVYCKRSDSACSVGRFNFGVGVGWSRYSDTSVFLPQLELQVALLERVALSISGGGLNSTGVYRTQKDVPSVVFGAGLHYYSRGSFRGFWFQVGFADYLYSRAGGNARYASEAAVLSTVGWRWRPEDVSGSFGVGLGAQRAFTSKASVQPLFRMDAAVDFNLDSVFF